MPADIYSEILAGKLQAPPPPPGWSDPAPDGLSHWVAGHPGSRPLCRLPLHYSGGRILQLPPNWKKCEDCETALGPDEENAG